MWNSCKYIMFYILIINFFYVWIKMSCFFILKNKNVVVIEWKFILMLFNCEYVMLNNVIDNKIIKVIIIIIEIII